MTSCFFDAGNTAHIVRAVHRNAATIDVRSLELSRGTSTSKLEYGQEVTVSSPNLQITAGAWPWIEGQYENERKSIVGP